MAYFAQIDENNVVVDLIVIPDDEEQNGAEFIANKLGKDGVWIQTSYNGRIKGRFAVIGSIYDPSNDAFLEPCPHAGWVLDENFDWIPPVPCPPQSETVRFSWSDAQQKWMEIRYESIGDTKIATLGGE